MKIQITKPKPVTYDGSGVEYEVKSFLPAGKRVYLTGQHAGWSFWVGPYLVNVIRKLR